MRKAVVFRLVAALFAVLIALAPPVFAAQYVIRVANVTPSTDPSGRTLADFERAVEAETGGRVDVRVFNDGVLGGELDTLDQVRFGALEMMLAHGIVLWQRMVPQLAVEELPFLFPTHEAAYAAIDGDFGAAITRLIEPTGFKVLAYWENGFRHFTNSKRPIVTPEDMRGLKFRSAESRIRLDMFRSLGALAVAMPFPELYTALQQGTVDGQENPLSISYGAKFYEVQKYLSLSGHIWGAAPLVANAAWWRSLPGDIQEALLRNARRFAAVQRQRVVEDDARLVKLFQERGVQVNEVNKEAFIRATQSVWEQWRPVIGNELMQLAERYRQGNK